ncbi:MAG: DNA internalization-related competence protein ComEC/Rec2 [Clostridia bacterium]|nr:DNA internalization-related competence protein ComEC/Rec2 [Clostridia bacterium]
MKRIICSVTILIIIIIMGLFKCGIALYDYKESEKGNYYATIIDKVKETQYTKVYLCKIKRKRFLLYAKKNKLDFEIGDIIYFYGTFEKGENQRNYGGFNYNLYLKTRKIYGIFKADSIKRIGNSKSLMLGYKKKIYKIRNNIISNFNNNLSKNNSALLSGIILGVTDKISKDVIENFQKSSLTHTLAISGENFMYIILIFKLASKRIRLKNFMNIITILSLIFFMELTGNTSSVIRAGIMTIIIILSKLLHRKYDFLTSLFLSLLVQIIYNPYCIFDVGLILSYSGVLGLAFFYKPLNSKIKSKLICGILATNIAIIPIIMYNFNIISFSFLITNLLSSFLIEIITILGFISIFFRLKIIYFILNHFLNILEIIISYFSLIPFSKVYVTTPSFLSITIYYVLVLSIFKLKKDKAKKTIVTFLTITIIALNTNYSSLFGTDRIKISFLDVGQGDCTVIQHKNKIVLIDGGGSSNSEYEIGKNIVIPSLLDKKIKKINYIIVSHFDTDHVGGLLEVMEELRVDNVIISKQVQENENYKRFIEIVNRKNIEIIIVEKGNKVQIDEKLFFEILWPNSLEILDDNVLNNNSIVCKLNYNDFSMLFTGDIEELAEKSIIETYKKDLKRIEATVLKVAHHGSKTSSSEEFLKAVKPKITLIGVGKNNKFGHPNEEVLSRIEKIRGYNI